MFQEEIENDFLYGKLDEEFPNVKDITYLDHAGATLYSQTQMTNVAKNLQRCLYGNPHSNNPPSNYTLDMIEHARCQILKMFNTTIDKYAVIFTSGATAALSLLADSFCFNDTAEHPGWLIYLRESHTSVVGMRARVAPKHVAVSVVSNSELKVFDESTRSKDNSGEASCVPTTRGLVVLTAQSNFSGQKYPLRWVKSVQDGCLNWWDRKGEHVVIGNRPSAVGSWFCALDAASFVATNHLDLDAVQPDFVCLSFYKIFGYPTGLGALLVRREAAHALEKRYFGGGTVAMIIPSKDQQVFRDRIEDRFEDGTLPFLSIMAVTEGIRAIHTLTGSMNRISRHVFNLARYFYTQLSTMTYENGQAVAEIYSNDSFANADTQGGIVAFNILSRHGKHVGYSTVEKLSAARSIIIRTGCFCNVGACQRYLHLSDDQVRQHHAAGHHCGDSVDLIDGNPTGAVRVSFGFMSCRRDVDNLLNMIRECFIESHHSAPIQMPHSPASYNARPKDASILTDITLFPVKSCAGYRVKRWPLTARGLMYDRHWIITRNGVAVTQKRERRLCLVKTSVDLDSGQLTLSAEGYPHINVSYQKIMDTQKTRSGTSLVQHIRVCRRNTLVVDCGQQAADWLSRLLCLDDVRLSQFIDNRATSGTSPVELTAQHASTRKTLVNDSPLTLVNSASVRSLLPDEPVSSAAARFRANLIVSSDVAYIEHSNALVSVRLGEDLSLPVIGKVQRCQVICLDQNTAESSQEPLLALKENTECQAGSHARNTFGIHLVVSNDVVLPVDIVVDTPVFWETEHRSNGI